MVRGAQNAPLKGIWQYACASTCKLPQRCLSKWIQPSLSEDPGRITVFVRLGDTLVSVVNVTIHKPIISAEKRSKSRVLESLRPDVGPVTIDFCEGESFCAHDFQSWPPSNLGP